MRRITALILILTLTAGIICSCKKEEEVQLPADFGTYGADFARNLATEYPYRKAYSIQEQLAGIMIKEEFEALGYEVQTQPFTSENGENSNNYIAMYKGSGFYSKNNDTGEYIPTERYIVIGAHYDSSYTREELDAYNAAQVEEKGEDAVTYSYDGINGNASGVGALMTCAKEINSYNKLGFNVIFVAFGASTDDFLGARTFLNALTPDVKSKIEAMFCIDSIYAGDKIYANSGLSSLLPGRKYAMRRKLYQTYDVAFENNLLTNNGFNLLYNESRLQVDVTGDEVADLYNEISVNKSDYVPFDEARIPVVFFDSFDYNFKSIEEMHDTKNLDLQDFGGMIRGTYLDSIDRLDPILNGEEGDLLATRINNVAFVILGAGMKGSDTALTYTQYMAALESERSAETAVTTTSTIATMAG